MPAKNAAERWVLTFDASCGTCREISAAVGDASGGRLEVLPLARPEVQRWRSRAFGENPPFTPTLLKVRGAGEDEVVHAWTSRGMALPLIGRLGPSKTLRVLAELGRLRAEADQPMEQLQAALDRKSFLRLAAGAAVASGLLLAGKTPAFAQERRAAAAAWVARAKDDLPQTYEAFSRYALDYRREIYRALPVDTRARLWREHLKRYRTAHPSLSALQKQALARAESFIANDLAFDPSWVRQPEQQQAERQLRRDVITSFGKAEAYQIVATLGPSRQPGRTEDLIAPMGKWGKCDCNMDDQWCSSHCVPSAGGYFCEEHLGCGWWWVEPCDGFCY